MDGTTTVVLNIDFMIKKYIQLRDKIKEVEEAHKIQLVPYVQALNRLEALLMSELDRAGVASMRASSGTIFKTRRISVTVQDWPVTFGFIQSNQRWDLLEARVNKTAAINVIEETGAPIPGVAVAQTTALNVRRG